MIIVAVVPVFDTLNSTIIVAVTFTLILLPLSVFLLMGLIIHKRVVRKFIIKNCKTKYTGVAVNDDTENSTEEFGMTVDDSVRINATICDV